MSGKTSVTVLASNSWASTNVDCVHHLARGQVNICPLNGKHTEANANIGHDDSYIRDQKVVAVHPLWHFNVCSKYRDNPSNNCCGDSLYKHQKAKAAPLHPDFVHLYVNMWYSYCVANDLI